MPLADERDRVTIPWADLLARLQQAQVRPDPFAPGAPFWNDPYIAGQLLAAQIDAHTDGASRRLSVIDEEAAWLAAALDLHPGQRVLDLGCGPGLYASRLAALGLAVTGIDLGAPALAYARGQAEARGLAIAYRCQDYLTLAEDAVYDVALLANGDTCSHSPEERARLFDNIHRALKPGGRLALDVLTRAHQERYGIRNGWYVTQGGLWRPGLHLVLEESFRYPQRDLTLSQYVIVDGDGAAIYRNWFQAFTPDGIRAELAAHGFRVDHLGGDLRGGAYHAASPWIGVIARREP